MGSKGEKVGQIESQGAVMQGQKHRSSGDFNISTDAGNYDELYWEVEDIGDPGSVSFNVYVDLPGPDQKVFKDVTNKSTTAVEVGSNFYIGDPEGTDGNSFQVKVYGYNT